jgi:hypothetical protein
LEFRFLNNAQRICQECCGKKQQTPLELADKTMTSRRITLHTGQLEVGFAQEEIFFFRTGFSFA